MKYFKLNVQRNTIFSGNNAITNKSCAISMYRKNPIRL